MPAAIRPKLLYVGIPAGTLPPVPEMAEWAMTDPALLTETIAYTAQDLDAAKALLASAKLKLGYTRIAAPFDGVTGERQVQPGDYVNIGTNLFQNPVVPYHDYTAAKGALLALTRTAAKEWGPHGIRVNMVSGGLLRSTDASAATPAAVFDLIAAQTPLRRVTTPEEMADAVVLLLSPLARGVTGQNLVVDGGLVMN
jgi:NAD(P)-dependent dehydrogenase (short-subunit alcohol dehydrogenase family)